MIFTLVKTISKEKIVGEIKKSLQYSILLPIILFLYFIIIVWNLIDYIYKKNTFEKYTNKYKVIIIIFFSVLAIIQWIINLNNPLLY